MLFPSKLLLYDKSECVIHTLWHKLGTTTDIYVSILVKNQILEICKILLNNMLYIFFAIVRVLTTKSCDHFKVWNQWPVIFEVIVTVCMATAKHKSHRWSIFTTEMLYEAHKSCNSSPRAYHDEGCLDVLGEGECASFKPDWKLVGRGLVRQPIRANSFLISLK